MSGGRPSHPTYTEAEEEESERGIEGEAYTGVVTTKERTAKDLTREQNRALIRGVVADFVEELGRL